MRALLCAIGGHFDLSGTLALFYYYDILRKSGFLCASSILAGTSPAHWHSAALQFETKSSHCYTCAKPFFSANERAGSITALGERMFSGKYVIGIFGIFIPGYTDFKEYVEIRSKFCCR